MPNVCKAEHFIRFQKTNKEHQKDTPKLPEIGVAVRFSTKSDLHHFKQVSLLVTC